jgi:hypothetical protein
VSGNKTLLDYNLDEIRYKGNNVIHEMMSVDGNMQYRNSDILFDTLFDNNTITYKITELPESLSSNYEITYNILKRTFEIKIYDEIKKSMVNYNYRGPNSIIYVTKNSEKTTFKFRELEWVVLSEGILKIILRSKNSVEIPIHNTLKRKMFERIAIDNSNKITDMQYGPYEK